MRRACFMCGTDPADGFAEINGRAYCHGDTPRMNGRTCYEVAQSHSALPSRFTPDGSGPTWAESSAVPGQEPDRAT